MKVKIYVEGAGNDNKALRADCQKGFREFFIKAKLAGKLPAVIPCGSRSKAYDDFCTALKSKKNTLALLLVDSEEAVSPEKSCWEHVKQRVGDGWKKPQGAKDDQIFMMVQVMESWFLADVATLKEYFGSGFKKNKIPNRDDIEGISKLNVYKALKDATSGCKEQYNKGKSSFKLLGKINPELVMQKSKHAKKLITKLKPSKK